MLMIELIVLYGIRFIRESNTSPLALKRGVWILCRLRLRFRCRVQTYDLRTRGDRLNAVSGVTCRLNAVSGVT